VRRNDAIRKGLIFKQNEPFSVRLKEFLDVRDAGKFLDDKFSRCLSHEPDGLIFQPSNEVSNFLFYIGALPCGLALSVLIFV